MAKKQNIFASAGRGNVPGAAQIAYATPLIKAKLTPRTGRFTKLHAILDDAADDSSNLRELLEKAWAFADHNNPQELNFVIALAQKFVTATGEPLPFEIE
jgi:hypothetical protein